MVDLAKVKADIRAGLLTVYADDGRLYMENAAEERIVLYEKEDNHD